MTQIRTGKVIGSEIAANKDGDTDVRILTVQLTDSDDIQTVEYYDDGGRDYRPADGAEVVVVDVSPSHRVVLAVDDLIDPEVAKGEILLYSVGTTGTAKAATIYFENDGTIQLNGTGDNAVRYNELETAFDQLKSEVNDFITLYNSHVHVESGGGSTVATVSSATSSTADITGAKIDEVEVSK